MDQEQNNMQQPEEKLTSEGFEELEPDTEELEDTEQMELVEQPPKKEFDWKKELWEWTFSIAIAVVLALVIRTFLFTLVQVDGPSMQNTMHTGDRLFVYRLMYEPVAGDIVVFTPERYPKKPYIKRVIATAGQTLDINYTTGDVIVDGKVLEEPYTKVRTMQTGDVKFPITVPEGYFFAMGDNRGQSHDCRNSDVGDSDNQSGLVSVKRVMGKALFRLWPMDQIGALHE